MSTAEDTVYVDGRKLRAFRELHGLSLAEAARRAGTDAGHLWRLEHNEIKDPGFSIVMRLARAYRVPIEALCDDQEYAKTVTPLIVERYGPIDPEELRRLLETMERGGDELAAGFEVGDELALVTT